jgi:hypothetical protein
LRMPTASGFMVHLAMQVGKCQNKMQHACIIGTVPRAGTFGAGP